MYVKDVSTVEKGRQVRHKKKATDTSFIDIIHTIANDHDAAIAEIEAPSPASALFCVQELGNNNHIKENELIEHGTELLDKLSELEKDLRFNGTIDKNKLEQIKDIALASRENHPDPNLEEIIDAIETRALVEFAKLSKI